MEDYEGWISRIVSMFGNLKLQNKFLTGFILVSVIPLLFVSVIIYRQAAQGLEDSSQEFAALYTSQIESSLNDFMEQYDKVTKSLVADYDIISRLGKEHKLTMDELIVQKLVIQRGLMRMALLKPEISSLMLISADNTVYQYANTTSMVNDTELLTQKWYKQLQDIEAPFFITGLHDRQYYDDKENSVVVTLGRILLGYDGAFAGMLLVDLDPSVLLELNHDFVLARDKYGMSVIISKFTGETIYHSDAASGRKPWTEVALSKTNHTLDSSNTERMVLTGNIELGDLVIKTEIPREKLLQKIDKVKWSTMFVILLGCLIMTIFSLGMSYTITKPIKALRRSMKQAELGQYLPIEKKQGKDEIGGLVHSYNRMITTIRTLIENVYIAEIKQRKAKFLALQNQINPHMLYNTLESIRMKALMKDDDEVAMMIKMLARMFRLTLGKDNTRHSIKHEIEYALNYIRLQNIRFDECFHLEIRIPEEIQECGILPLVFQPIVENSINHGFYGYSKRMIIGIEASFTVQRDIRIRITDDGSGMSFIQLVELHKLLEEAETDKYRFDQVEESDGKGLGLKNIAERIKLHYGDQYGITIYSEVGKGTTVELLIPCSGLIISKKES